MTRDDGVREGKPEERGWLPYREGCSCTVPKVTQGYSRCVLPELKDITLTRGCGLRNCLKIKCIPFLSVSKLGQRLTDGDLAIQGGRKDFSRNPYPQNNKMGTFKD